MRSDAEFNHWVQADWLKSKSPMSPSVSRTFVFSVKTTGLLRILKLPSDSVITGIALPPGQPSQRAWRASEPHTPLDTALAESLRGLGIVTSAQPAAAATRGASKKVVSLPASHSRNASVVGGQ